MLQGIPPQAPSYTLTTTLIAVASGAASSIITWIFSRKKQRADTVLLQAKAENIKADTIITILQQLETIRENREKSDEQHRLVVIKLQEELDKALDNEREQRLRNARKWQEIGNCYIYMSLLEDDLNIPPERRYKRKTREQIVEGL